MWLNEDNECWIRLMLFYRHHETNCECKGEQHNVEWEVFPSARFEEHPLDDVDNLVNVFTQPELEVGLCLPFVFLLKTFLTSLLFSGSWS